MLSNFIYDYARVRGFLERGFFFEFVFFEFERCAAKPLLLMHTVASLNPVNCTLLPCCQTFPIISWFRIKPDARVGPMISVSRISRMDCRVESPCRNFGNTSKDCFRVQLQPPKCTKSSPFHGRHCAGPVCQRERRLLYPYLRRRPGHSSQSADQHFGRFASFARRMATILVLGSAQPYDAHTHPRRYSLRVQPRCDSQINHGPPCTSGPLACAGSSCAMAKRDA